MGETCEPSVQGRLLPVAPCATHDIAPGLALVYIAARVCEALWLPALRNIY
jgi:hypothetical protein